MRGLKVGFGDHLVMDGLDIDVRRGEVLGLVGASGAGKSVFTRTVLGLLPKLAGTIEVYGHDIDSLTAAERRRVGQRWGVLFQQGALFSGLTVKQNIQAPMREHLDLSPRLRDELAMLKIALVGLPEDAANKYPRRALWRHDQAGGAGARARARPRPAVPRRADLRASIRSGRATSTN